MIMLIEDFNDLPVHLDGVWDPNFARLSAVERRGDRGLTVTGRAGHEQAAARIRNESQCLHRALRQHQS